MVPSTTSSSCCRCCQACLAAPHTATSQSAHGEISDSMATCPTVALCNLPAAATQLATLLPVMQVANKPELPGGGVSLCEREGADQPSPYSIPRCYAAVPRNAPPYASGGSAVHYRVAVPELPTPQQPYRRGMRFLRARGTVVRTPLLAPAPRHCAHPLGPH